MGFDYFYGRGTEPFAFLQVPRVLIEDERFADITTDAKFLYSFMLNRSFLSARSGWLDDAGRVYIYYTLEQIMADMHCANQKGTKLLKELVTLGPGTVKFLLKYSKLEFMVPGPNAHIPMR